MNVGQKSSHLGEPAHLTGPAHLHMNNPNGSLHALFLPEVRFRLGMKYFLFTCIFHYWVKSMRSPPVVKQNHVQKY